MCSHASMGSDALLPSSNMYSRWMTRSPRSVPRNRTECKVTTTATRNRRRRMVVPWTSRNSRLFQHHHLQDDLNQPSRSRLLLLLLERTGSTRIIMEQDDRPTSTFETEETGATDDFKDLNPDSDKAVRFADPLVTSSWDVPRIDENDIEVLFYSALDIERFRRQRKQCGFVRNSYDPDHCESLVQSLDRIGLASLTAGEYNKALEAFHHSLRVKTEIIDDGDDFSIAETIHCIADVYSKKGKWILAMDTYNTALEVLEKGDVSGDEDAERLMAVLLQKVIIVRKHLGIQQEMTL